MKTFEHISRIEHVHTRCARIACKSVKLFRQQRVWCARRREKNKWNTIEFHTLIRHKHNIRKGVNRSFQPNMLSCAHLPG